MSWVPPRISKIFLVTHKNILSVSFLLIVDQTSIPQTAPVRGLTCSMAFLYQSLLRMTSLSTKTNHGAWTASIPFCLAVARVPLSERILTLPYFLLNFAKISRVWSVEPPSTAISVLTGMFW